MRKLFILAFKDLTLAFRDRAAIILMLVAPFALTLGLGAVTGRFSGASDDGGIRDIPVVIVNQDGGQLGQALLATMQSSELDALLTVRVLSDATAARAAIDDDSAAAVIIVPPGFTDSVMASTAAELEAAPVRIELLVNPARPMTSGIVRAIVEEFVNRLEAGRTASLVAIEQLVRSGRLAPEPDALAAFGREFGQRMADAPPQQAIALERSSVGAAPSSVDPLAFLAPGMALLFLMYTVTRGGGSLLAEQREGTLPRLLVTPTSAPQVLGGKVLGIFLTAVAQVTILIGASTLFFGLRWGNPLGLLLLVPAVAAGATGWGVLIAAFARTTAQVGSIGSSMMLLFGVLGNSFGQDFQLPDWLQAVGRITPNAWGVQAFARLAQGGTLADIAPAIGALLLMAAVLFGISAARLSRAGFAK